MCNPEWYAAHVMMIPRCITGQHTTVLDNGDTIKCAHHEDDYSTPAEIRCDCPLHNYFVEKILQKLADMAPKMIDEMLGKGDSNWMESGFNALWLRGTLKRMQLSFAHLLLSTGMGAMESNRTAMAHIKGEKYSWLLEVLKKLNLDILPSIAAAESIAMKRHAATAARVRTARHKVKKSVGKARRASMGGQRTAVSKLLRAHLPKNVALDYTGEGAALLPSPQACRC